MKAYQVTIWGGNIDYIELELRLRKAAKQRIKTRRNYERRRTNR